MKHIVISVLLICLLISGCASHISPDSSATSPVVSPMAPSSPAPAQTIKPTSTPLFAIELEKLPEQYPEEAAVKNGDFVVGFNKMYNLDKFTTFIEAVSNKQSAAVRIRQTTVEGDPIIMDVVFDGSGFTVWNDATRDKFGDRKITKYEYTYLFQYDRNGYRMTVLSDNAFSPDKENQEAFALVAYPIDATPTTTPSPAGG